MIKIWFDGCCKGNPGGRSGAGAVIEKNGKTLLTISKYIGDSEKMSCNVAEYEALMAALMYLFTNKMENEKIMVYGDSSLVISQMSQNWKIKKGLYKLSALKTKALVRYFSNVSFKWIPREQNTAADELSNLAVKRNKMNEELTA